MEISCVVEGQGDVASLPILVRRVADGRGWFGVSVPRPYRVQRNKVVRPGELERIIEAVARRRTRPAGVLLVLDSDDDAPCMLGPALAARARAARPDVPSAVVLANTEKETWFLSAAESIRGQRDLPADLEAPGDPEAIRGAKEWLSRQMQRPYSEVSDQPALAATFDLALARDRSRSFRRFCREVERLVGLLSAVPEP